MIKDLFIYNIKENKVLVIAFTLIVMMYATISVGMYDPTSTDALDALTDLLPKQMVEMFGFSDLGGSMVKYLSNYLYGFILLMFPMIFIIMLGTKLVSKHVDKGSMTYLITMPYTRKQIVLTQSIFFVVSIIFIFLINIIVMILMSAIVHPGNLDVWLFIMVNLVTISVHIFLSSIAFLFSVIYGDAQKSLGITGIILALFIVLHMLSGLGDSTEFLKYFTPFSFVNIEYILEGGGHGLLSVILLLVFSTGIYYTSIILFDRKSIII